MDADQYKLPPGYNLWQSFRRTYKQVKYPIASIEESMDRFGGTYSVNLGRKQLIATQDPGFIDHVLRANHKNYFKSTILTEQLGRFIGNGLLTANGDYWLKQRRLIQPGFHHDKIQALYKIIEATIEEFLATFPQGKIVDVYPFMNSLAFEIVINSLFTIRIPPAEASKLSCFISETQNFVIKDIRQPHKSWWYKLSGELRSNVKKSEEARQIIRSIIRERKKHLGNYNDLLDMLLSARYEDSGEGMSEEQIIDEILILVIAGHETTANALSWMLYLLATNPDKQSKLHLETPDQNLQDIVSNPYLQAVIQEGMRLYPPAWISDRVALKDDRYNGFHFPKDTIIILFYYGLHRDALHWDDPLIFNPERFTQREEKGKHKTFYPFGGGPRLCIGNHFALAEMALALRALVHRYRFKTSGFEPHADALITLRPDRVVLDIEKR